jgi:hypothetical protein
MKRDIIDGLKFWGPLNFIWILFLRLNLSLYDFAIISWVAIIIFWFATLATELKIYDIVSDFDIKTGQWKRIRRVE